MIFSCPYILFISMLIYLYACFLIFFFRMMFILNNTIFISHQITRNYFEQFDCDHSGRWHTVYNCRDREITQISRRVKNWVTISFPDEHYKEIRRLDKGSRGIFYPFFFYTITRPDLSAAELILFFEIFLAKAADIYSSRAFFLLIIDTFSHDHRYKTMIDL